MGRKGKEIDVALMQQLHAEGKGLREIGNAVGLSAPSVMMRLRKLEASSEGKVIDSAPSSRGETDKASVSGQVQAAVVVPEGSPQEPPASSPMTESQPPAPQASEPEASSVEEMEAGMPVVEAPKDLVAEPYGKGLVDKLKDKVNEVLTGNNNKE